MSAQGAILITGAGRRVGAAIAEYLHAAGWPIVVHYRHSKAQAEQLVQQCNALRADSAWSVAADLSDPKACQAVIAEAIACAGSLQALVNNASIFYPTPVADTTPAQWDEIMSSNVKAPFFLSQSAAPHLAKTQGCIITLADVHAKRPMQEHSVYCISQAAVVMQTKALAQALAPTVRVNAIAPGLVLAPDSGAICDSAVREKIVARTALQRYGDPHAVAEAVAYLLTADYVTGEVLTVDGGRSLSM